MRWDDLICIQITGEHSPENEKADFYESTKVIGSDEGIRLIVLGPINNEALLAKSVEIDIKPGSYPNCFDSDGNGIIPIAVLSGPDFNATQVEPSTISLNGQGVKFNGKGLTMARLEDVNGDNLDDIVAQIEDIDGTKNSGDTVAALTGRTIENTYFL